MKSQSTRIAITGDNGFVAKNLRKVLNKKKISTISISRRNFKPYKHEFKIISSNLSEDTILPNLRNCDVLVHLIGIGKEKTGSNYTIVNLELTKKIIKICKKAKIKKIIYLSGLGVLKNSTSNYFISKFEAEQEIVNSGLDYTVFRPSFIIGKGDLLSKNLKKQIKKGTIIIPSSGKYKLQPIFVNDVAEIILKAIVSNNFSKQVLDLVGPETVSFENFVKTFINSRNVKIKNINLKQAYFSAVHNKKSIYSVEELNILLGSFVGDFNTLKKLCGFKLKSYKEILKSSNTS